LGVNVSTDSRRPLSLRLSASGNANVAGGSSLSASLGATYRPSPSVTVSMTPSYLRSHDIAQYVRAADDATAAPTYGRRYVFANVDLRTLELATRLDWTFTSRLSLQLYMQPLIASGDYHDFKELARPRTYDYTVYGRDAGTLRSESSRYYADPDGAGPAPELSFADPDLNIRSLRGSAVLRWEFRPGSAAYFVWNQNRADNGTELGRLDAGDDFSRLANAPSDDVFLVKVSYWLPM
ncbi:MAG TPA: DUF5916 domain-containing protein, partial [Candidatus Synoicihabitans sp.]|nr:DUF5916 domain-containing protein [Candidatus Synoicihabitans sp.]